jgi:ATP-dependent DNA ligase
MAEVRASSDHSHLKFILYGLAKVHLSEVFDISPQQLVAAARRSGLEDIIAKRADSRYESAWSNILVGRKLCGV